MHTLMILGGGFALLASVVLLGKALGFGLGSALIAYILVWVAISAYNMWVGVNHAGYSYRDEFPIFLAIAGVPALAALLIRWKFG